MHIPLNKSTMGEEEKNAAKAVIDSDNLTMGKQCRAFEREFADYLGVEHAVMVNSGSSANLIALFAMADALVPSDGALPAPHPAGIGGHRSGADLVDHDLAGVAGRAQSRFSSTAIRTRCRWSRTRSKPPSRPRPLPSWWFTCWAAPST